MKRRYTRKAIEYPGINFKGHMYAGTVWPFPAKDGEYSVTLTEKGLTCDCYGMIFHGKCRHVRDVGERLVG